ncbi:hypothetical protein Fot_11356 [Forsythia ovata]|uniref:Uncharacterized protein n=1 Tax=Forsythia ovata TaxID=205694 RepID=A0ABD1WJF9_9LAMI
MCSIREAKCSILGKIKKTHEGILPVESHAPTVPQTRARMGNPFRFYSYGVHGHHQSKCLENNHKWLLAKDIENGTYEDQSVFSCCSRIWGGKLRYWRVILSLC